MGADIHMVLEKWTGKHWLGINPFKGHHKCYAKKGEYDWSSSIATERNYRRFAALAGVRGEGPSPKGVPLDASELSKFLIDQWDGDGHSHSWLSLREAIPIFLETHFEKEREHVNKYPASYFFELEDKKLDDYRLVFWFDN